MGKGNQDAKSVVDQVFVNIIKTNPIARNVVAQLAANPAGAQH